MASMTFSNPGMGNLFSGLANALGGASPDALIAADLKRTQRDNVLSDTAINQQTLGTMKRQEAAMSELANVLGDPTLAATPEGRANLMSILSQVPDGLKMGPGFATGAASFTDPNFVESESDFSRILAGTGVQPNWSQTPAGYADGLQNNLDQVLLQQAGETQRAMLPSAAKPGTPLAVSPALASKFGEMIRERLGQKLGGAEVDAGTLNDIAARAATLYQTSRSAPNAIEQAIAESNVQVSGAGAWNPGLLPWDWLRTSPGIAKGSAPLAWEWDEPTLATGQDRAALPGSARPPLDLTEKVKGALQARFPNIRIDDGLLESAVSAANAAYRNGGTPDWSVRQGILAAAPAAADYREPGPFTAWNPLEWGGDPGVVRSSPVAAPTLGPAATELPTHPLESVLGSLFEGLAYAGLSGGPMQGAVHMPAGLTPTLPGGGADANPAGRQHLPVWGPEPATADPYAAIRASTPLDGGPRVGHDASSGYYMVEGDRRVPLYQGSVIKSPSTGALAVFIDGQWFPLPAER